MKLMDSDLINYSGNFGGVVVSQAAVKAPAERNMEGATNRLQQALSVLLRCEDTARVISDAIDPVPQDMKKLRPELRPNITQLASDLLEVAIRLSALLTRVSRKL